MSAQAEMLLLSAVGDKPGGVVDEWWEAGRDRTFGQCCTRTRSAPYKPRKLRGRWNWGAIAVIFCMGAATSSVISHLVHHVTT
jgi:hypothetical protein